MRVIEVCLLGRLLDLSDRKLKEKIERALNHFIKFLCKCLLYIVNGNDPIRKNFVDCHKKLLRKLLSRQTFLKHFAWETVGQNCWFCWLSLFDKIEMHTEVFIHFNSKTNVCFTSTGIKVLDNLLYK